MHQSKRARWDTGAVLDVRSWLSDNQTGAFPDVQVSQPLQLARWSKLSSAAEGVTNYSFGSTEGQPSKTRNSLRPIKQKLSLGICLLQGFTRSGHQSLPLT